MSKKKILNLIELLVHIPLLAVICILPYVNIRQGTGWPDVVAVPGDYTLVEYLIQFPNWALMAFVVLIVLNAAICIGSIFMKTQKKDGAVHIVLPIIFLVIWFFFYNAAYEPGYDITIYPLGRSIVIILMAIIVFLAVLKRSNFVFSQDNSPAVIIPQSNTSNADELKKYRDLLDSGVISQEEFDAKKKQLLGL